MPVVPYIFNMKERETKELILTPSEGANKHRGHVGSTSKEGDGLTCNCELFQC
jgi:hypothetical protein